MLLLRIIEKNKREMSVIKSVVLLCLFLSALLLVVPISSILTCTGTCACVFCVCAHAKKTVLLGGISFQLVVLSSPLERLTHPMTIITISFSFGIDFCSSTSGKIMTILFFTLSVAQINQQKKTKQNDNLVLAFTLRPSRTCYVCLRKETQ